MGREAAGQRHLDFKPSDFSYSHPHCTVTQAAAQSCYICPSLLLGAEMPGIWVPRCKLHGMQSWHGLPQLFGQLHPGCHRPLSSDTHKQHFQDGADPVKRKQKRIYVPFRWVPSGVLELPAPGPRGEQGERISSSIQQDVPGNAESRRVPFWKLSKGGLGKARLSRVVSTKQEAGVKSWA